MFCPNCRSGLLMVDNSKLLSQTSQAEYWTHQCPICKTYWHLHLAGDDVVLIATKSDQIASVKIVDDLKIELSERVFKL